MEKSSKLFEETTSDTSKVEVVTMKKSVTFIYGLCMFFGTVVGSGIFTSVKASFNVFDEGKPIGMVLFFWFTAGLISIGGALCYAELGTRIRESGGERAYFSQIISVKLARVFVIFYVFIIKTLTIAGLCIVTGEYIYRIYYKHQTNEIAVQIIALIILVVCITVNCISKKVALKAGVVLTILKTLAMIIIIICGIVYICAGKAKDWNKPFTITGFSLDGLISCYVALFWSYDGWSTLSSIVGEMKNPTRDLPRAIIAGAFLVTLLYVLTVASYSTVLGYDQSKVSLTIAASLAVEALNKASPVIPILICCSTIGAINGCLYGISSVSSSAGYSGELPRIFSLVHRRTRTPIFSLISIGIISAAFTLLDFDTIMDYCAFLSWIFYFMAFCALWKIKLETRHKIIDGVFKVPYAIIVPIQVVCIFIVVASFKQNYIPCTIFLCALILSIAVQFIPSKYTQIPFILQAHDSAIKAFSRIQLELACSSDIS